MVEGSKLSDFETLPVNSHDSLTAFVLLSPGLKNEPISTVTELLPPPKIGMQCFFALAILFNKYMSLNWLLAGSFLAVGAVT